MNGIGILESIHMFRCPLCGGKMRMSSGKSILCEKKHCFDLSRKGYVNLLPGPVETEYDKGLLNSRSLMIKSGLFNPLIEKLGGLILEYTSKASPKNVSLLDAGCGEGSHLARIIENIKGRTGKHITGVGIDISKEGIQIASRDYPGITWCVADLAKLPFAGGSFGVILNILSPANYAEFRRLLTDNGILIKVVPGSGYLVELRELLYRSTEKEEYSNERVIAHFKESFCPADTRQVLYNMPVGEENLEHLIRMTPLSWGAADESIKEALDSGISSVTVDLTVILGSKQKL